MVSEEEGYWTSREWSLLRCNSVHFIRYLSIYQVTKRNLTNKSRGGRTTLTVPLFLCKWMIQMPLFCVHYIILYYIIYYIILFYFILFYFILLFAALQLSNQKSILIYKKLMERHLPLLSLSQVAPSYQVTHCNETLDWFRIPDTPPVKRNPLNFCFTLLEGGHVDLFVQVCLQTDEFHVFPSSRYIYVIRNKEPNRLVISLTEFHILLW
jgi:hypothetical protein